MRVFGTWQIKTWPLFFPLAMSITAFVLSMIALFAGTGSGGLEDYHIFAVNVSRFGQDLIPTPTQSGLPQPSQTGGGGFWSNLESSLEEQLSQIGNEIQNTVTGQVNDVLGDVADEVTEKLGISEWYSLHIMNWCQGDYAPNSTVDGSWYNITNCTDRGTGAQFNLTETLNHEIRVGPLSFNTAEIPLPDKINDAIDTLNSALHALFIIFALGAALSGFTILLTLITMVASFMWGRTSHHHQNGHFKTIFGNMLFNLLAMVVLLAAAAVATIASQKAASEVTDAGKSVGIVGSKGMKFVGICWGAFVAMFLGFVYWFALFFFPKFKQPTKSSV